IHGGDRRPAGRHPPGGDRGRRPGRRDRLARPGAALPDARRADRDGQLLRRLLSSRDVFRGRRGAGADGRRRRAPAFPPRRPRAGDAARLREPVRRERGDRPFVAAVTNGAGSTLARLADRNLDTRGGEEHGPSTMTFAATLVLMAALTRSLAGRDPASAADAEAAAVAAGRLMADAERTARELADWLGDRPVLALLGRGESRAAA